MNFRNRLVLFLMATLIGVQALTIFSSYLVIRQNLIEHGRTNLEATSETFVRQLNLLAERVGEGVRILALDYPLRQAIAEKDTATITSALRNHGLRVGAKRMFLVGLDGRIVVDTTKASAIGQRFAFPDLTRSATTRGSAMGLVALDGKVFWIVTVSVNAPLPIAFVAAAVPVDDALIENLRRMSVLPTMIALVLRNGSGFEIAAKSAERSTTLALSPDMALNQAVVDEIDGVEFLTLAAKLPTVAQSPAVLALFDYPLSQALGPFYDIALPVGLALVIGLGIAILGAFLIARGVSRPIEALAQTARHIATGDYTVPSDLPQQGEIGDLSRAISGMTSAIAVRQTQLETAAAALEVARDDALRANKAKSQFLANMSHELRTPLNAIIGFGDLIHGEVLGPIGNERYTEYAGDIRNSGAHLLMLVEEVLDLAKVEAGTLKLSTEPTAPGDVLKGILPIVVAMADKAKIDIEVKGDPGTWPVIDGDPLKLKQVFINLISNAVKFTPEGGRVTVSAEAKPDVLVLRVSDTGIGIKSEDIPLIVQPFYRVNSALNASYQGAGLGLPLTKAIVDLHGGKLSIESSIGRGTTVTVSLPRRPNTTARARAAA